MNDHPQVDNPQGIVRSSVEKKRNLFSLDSKQPGAETGSTALDLKNLSEQQKTKEDQLMQVLMQGIKEEKSPIPPMKVQPEKNIEPKKTSATSTPKNNQSVQKGFLMPFVNGFNNFLEGFTNALKSLIPMKPQTGGGTV